MRAIQKNGGSILMCLLEIFVGVLLLIDPIRFTSSIIVVIGAALLIAGLLIARHHANIGRLLHGKENKLSFRKKT